MLDAFQRLNSPSWLAATLYRTDRGELEQVGMRKGRKAGGQRAKEIVAQLRVEKQDLKSEFCHS